MCEPTKRRHGPRDHGGAALPDRTASGPCPVRRMWKPLVLALDRAWERTEGLEQTGRFPDYSGQANGVEDLPTISSVAVVGGGRRSGATVSPSHVVGVTNPSVPPAVWLTRTRSRTSPTPAGGRAPRTGPGIAPARYRASPQSAWLRSGRSTAGFDGIAVRIEAVDGHGEPQGQPARPAGQVIGVVARVPLLGILTVEDLEIRGVLGVDRFGQVGWR